MSTESLKEVLESRLSANRFARAILTLTTGQALGQVIGLLTTPLCSRLYDTAAYGEYAIIVSTATIICTVSQAGLASAVMMPEDEAEARRVFNAAVVFSFMLSCAVIFTLWMLEPWLHVFDLSVSYSIGLILLLVYVNLTNLNNLMRVYMNRLKQYRSLCWNSLISALATLLITIPLGMLGFGFVGFVIAACVAAFACHVQMMHKANPFEWISFCEVKEVFVTYKRFVYLQLPSNALSTLSQQLPNQVLASVFGSASLGSFSMSNKILGIPSRLMANPINTVYFRTAVEYVHEGRNLAAFTFKIISWAMWCWAPLILLLVVFGDSIFGFILGDQWREAGSISGILAFWYALSFCNTCVSYCRVSLDRQGINLIVSIVSVAVTAASLALGASVTGNIVGTLICFSAGACLVQMIDMLINFACMKKNVLRYLFFSVTYVLVVGGTGLVLRYALGI